MQIRNSTTGRQSEIERPYEDLADENLQLQARLNAVTDDRDIWRARYERLRARRLVAKAMLTDDDDDD